jgi:riboflavin kinase/FMN adenylyltransferase
MNDPSMHGKSTGLRRYAGPEAATPEAFHTPVVTIGMFDGLHRGHRHVIEHLCALADRAGGDAVVVTFETHPRLVLEGKAPGLLLSTEHRLLLLGRLGVDAVVLLPFDEQMRQTTYEAFVRDLLVKRIGVSTLLLGFDSNFGHGGEGTAATVAPLAAELGFEIVEAPPISLHGEPISSSRIRAAILEGDFATASDMLGRTPALYGVVIRGDGRGRTLGFPTANIDLEGELLPPPGVYQVVTTLRGERRAAVANIGVRPTFLPDGAEGPAVPILEVYVPGVDFEFYGERMEVELVRKIRDERRFPSKEALVAQIKQDVASLGGGALD